MQSTRALTLTHTPIHIPIHTSSSPIMPGSRSTHMPTTTAMYCIVLRQKA